MDLPIDAGAPRGEPASTASVDIPTVSAPSIDPAEPAPVDAAGAHEHPSKAEAVPAHAASADAKTRPALPRAAVLVVRPDDKPGAAAPEPAASPSPRSGGRRFALLAAGLTVAAAIGAVAGSAGIAGFERLFAAAPVVAARSETTDEVRVLKDTVAQLRMNVKSLSENLAALRTTIAASTTAANAQFTKITEAIERVEHAKNERRVTTLTPSPEPTGAVPPSPPASVDPKAAAKPPVVEGWAVRRVFGSDAALVEGRYGVVEVEPGDLVPGLGRIQEIKRQDGHWVIVTSRGLIVSSR
jgi:hypothetical protein